MHVGFCAESAWGNTMHLSRGRTVTIALGLAAGFATFANLSARAQNDPLVNPGQLTTGSQQQLQRLNKETRPEAPPPSLPGTKPASVAADASRAASEMSPTEALFDAINRGDSASARDAVNRGADLHGTNVLGLTPLELSVDLGRNDISFFLLSMRDADAGSRATARNGGAPGGAAQADAMLRGGAAPKLATRARAIPASAPATAADPVPDGPRLFSGDGGTPIPAAGFLGFDARQAAR